MTSNSRALRLLVDIDETDADQVGRKAAVLGALQRAGFPVPDGVVLTIGSGDQSDDEIAQLLAAARRLGGPLAVRSSGVAEDGIDRTYAGQHTTALNVRGEQELVVAVENCLRSVKSDHVRAYRGGGADRLAILVQRMVAADAAGVAFTANPVTGDLSDVVVNAVRGLGDQLVSGAITPDEWLIRDGSARPQPGTREAISPTQALAVANLARRVAAHFGVPQDIEWAIAGDELFLLQARPITALPIAVPSEPPPGFWERDAAHSPTPVSPMLRSVFPFNDALRHVAAEYGLLVELVIVEIGGWNYFGAVPVGGKPGRPAPPAWLLAILCRLAPAIRRRVRACVHAVRDDRPMQIIHRWHTELQPYLAARIGALRDVDLAALDDEALDQHLTDVERLFAEAIDIHFLVGFAHGLVVGEFGLACHHLLGWDDIRILELLAGLSTTSTEPAHRLSELSRQAAGNPAVRALIATPDATIAELAVADPAFAAAFTTYQHTYGCRTLQYDVLHPTIAERPALTLGLLHDQLTRGYDPTVERDALAEQRASTVAAARAAIPAGERTRFDHLLARAQRGYPVREDNEFFTVSVPMALVRIAALELGRRLGDRRLLNHRDDVFFLELDEARAALRGQVNQIETARRRRGERAWALAHPGPPSYGTDPGPPPSLRGFPTEVRQTATAITWILDRMIGASTARRPDAALGGTPASPGSYRGPVRVINSESEFGRLQAGDVLVCPSTSAVWSVLFPSVGALVTDAGGTLSHPAIIAREYRIPAVVATGNGTRLLRDGQVVTVDGTLGTIDVEP